MRIQRTPRRANFTIVGNDVLRNRSLSFTARGILSYLLSLPDGADEDVRKLADKNPIIGRDGIKAAVDELIEARYYFRHTYRNSQGQVRTAVYVFDTPQDSFTPLPDLPGTGPATPGTPGRLPSVGKDLESKNETKTPPFSPAATVQPPVEREGNNGQEREAARLLGGLGSIDSRLALSAKQATALIPLAAQWLHRGATIAEITDALTQGLPPRVYSAAKLISDRLGRKLPAPRRQWKSYADCEASGCGRLLPAEQDSGICRHCALGTIDTPAPTATVPDISGPNAAWHAARAAMRAA
ncbi:hypothetical protein AB0I84_00720 [Streptomyces spectabilis]|uniref:hypothetical protein n=1 Tax=Streptomyces spectabilis TaxID=68270 RepID=UPI0033E2692C